MIDQEKELADFLKDIYYNAPYVGDEFIETAKAIIAKYQQIEKKPVQLYKTDDEICIILDKRFATENERQAWLDSHYVELVD